MTDEKREDGSEKERKLFPNLTKLPVLELRKVLPTDSVEAAWAVTTEIVLRARSGGDFDSEFAVLEIFTGTETDCKARAEAFMNGYLKGLKRILG